jgi:tRNA(Leu) C34 or U34 (ribose-2'-O)-methylase TrmL
VLLMGSERQGLPAELENLADTMVRIPMSGSVDSLNLAIATSLVLYEARDQRQLGSDCACTPRHALQIGKERQTDDA